MAVWTILVYQSPILIKWQAKSGATCRDFEQEVRSKTASVMNVSVQSLCFAAGQPPLPPPHSLVGSCSVTITYQCLQPFDVTPILMSLEKLQAETAQLRAQTVQLQEALADLTDEKEKLRDDKEKLRDDKDKILVGQIAYSMMSLLRNFTFNGQPPPCYGAPPNVKEFAKTAHQLDANQQQKWMAALQSIDARLPFGSYAEADKQLRHYRMHAAHATAEHTVSAKDLYDAVNKIPWPQFRADVAALVQILQMCSSVDRPLLPDLQFMP